jgi:hypothetical protein
MLCFAACTKKQADGNSSLPSTGNDTTPPTSTSITAPGGQSIGQVVAQVPGATVIQTATGETFALSTRAGISTVFSTTLIVQKNGQALATNCVFASADCSGPCLIDANAGTPLPGSLMLANQLHQLQGPVWKADRYDNQPVIAAFVALHSRLDLYGDGPYCSSSISSLDHYYILTDASTNYSGLDNSQWQISSP